MLMKNKSTDIINLCLCIIMTVYGAALLLLNIVIPSLVIRNIIASLALVMEFLLIYKKKLPFALTVHMLLIAVLCVYKTAWSLNAVLIYFVAVFSVLVYIYNVKLARMLLTALYFCDIFYCIITIFLRFNKDIYINYVVKLFPDTEERLIDWYNNNCMAGLTEHYSTNAMLLSVGFIIAFSQFMAHIKYRNIKYKDIFEVGLFSIGVLLTGKRGHVIFIFLTVLVILFCSIKEKNAIKRTVVTLFRALLIILAVALLLRFVPSLSSFVTRFHSGVKSNNATDISHGRFELWQLAWDTFKKHKLFGIGWKQYNPLISVQYSKRATYDTHNVYLQLLCETGIIGFSVVISWFVKLFVLTIKVFRKKIVNFNADFETRFLMFFSLGYQAFFLSYCLTGNPLYVRIMFIPYFTACGITLYYSRHKIDISDLDTVDSKNTKGENNV